MSYSARQIYRNRPRHHRDTKKIVFIIGIAVLFIVLLFLFLTLFTSVFSPPPLFSPLPVSPSADIASSGENIYYLKGTTLYCTDLRGEEQWSTKFAGGEQDLTASGAAICLYNDSSATVMDTDRNPLFTVPASDFIIRDVACGNSSVAMLCDIEGETPSEYIRIFDLKGTEINRVDLKGSEVLKFGFSGSGDSLWYLTLDATGVYPISQITTLSPSQQKLTGMYKIYDQLVSNVNFFNTDMYVSGTTYLTSYDTFGSKISDTLIYGTKNVASFLSKDDLVLAYAPMSSVDNSYYTVRLLSRSGIDTLIQLPSGVEHFALSQQYVYCFGKDTAYLYKYSGEFVKSIPLDFSLSSVQLLSDSAILLKSSSAVYIMNLE